MLSVSQPRTSVWNSKADYLHDLAIEFKSSVNDDLVCTLLGTMYRVCMSMCCINLLFT